MKKILEFRHVKKFYQIGEVKIEALKGVDFDINEGEFVVILGASTWRDGSRNRRVYYCGRCQYRAI
jgi:predicted ABC-type transport system involved in lysophospholipase L1 biosynthesis ATPase subunit